MVRVLVALVLALSAAGGAQEPSRSQYQRVIDKWYPGFRILAPADLGTPSAKALIVGRFNYDGFQGFAAFVVSTKKSHFASGASSYDYYVGKIVVCLGASTASVFRCEAEDRPVVTLPHDSTLERIPPGKYTCLEENGRTRTVTTTIDSVGEGSEKASQFRVRDRSGAVSWCITAD